MMVVQGAVDEYVGIVFLSEKDVSEEVVEEEANKIEIN